MSDNASLPSNMEPVASECVVADLPIQGELPRALNGTLFRNFDAADIAHGPVATVRLPLRVPAGFHGNWVAGAA